MKKNEIETEFGIIIPNLMNIPEGSETSYVNPLNEETEYTSIDRVFSFDCFPLLNFGDSVTTDFDYYSLPMLKEKAILPFASDAGGYFFCFDYQRSKDRPSITLWIRDNPEECDFVLLANSFEEFIDSLKDESESASE